jgi:RND family efflux transporter MFP subunit
MLPRVSRALAIIGAIILLVSASGCSIFQPSQPKAPPQIIVVQRSNMTQTVSVDGNLQMPQAFNLSFGAPGNVRDVFVAEGDYIKAGTMMARLDSATQELNIKAANASLQLTLSNLYETIPALQQVFPITSRGTPSIPVAGTPPSPGPSDISKPWIWAQSTGWEETAKGYFNYYPNSSASLAISWALDEANKAQTLFNQNNYGNAVLELRIAAVDLDSCIRIFQDALDSPYSGLGNAADYVNIPDADTLGNYTYQIMYIRELNRVIDLMKQSRSDLEKVQSLIAQGKYTEGGNALESALGQLGKVSLAVKGDVNWIKVSFDQSAPGKNICGYFFQAAQDKLNQALISIQKGGLSWVNYTENVRAAMHCIQICNSIMGGNVMVLEHGLSLKNYQQTNVDLAKAAVTVANSNDDLLKTVLIAPFDGTVVSVGVKRNDVLSNMDYSSKVAVQLVDTTVIKFTGNVDEIDIIKIKTGQTATIAVDAIPDKTFNGTVTFISPFGTPDTTSRVVLFPITVELKLEPGDIDLLKGGLTSTATISVASLENVLLMPLTAVSTDKAEKSVMVMNEATGQSEKRAITVGKQNQQMVEVLSGLKEGDKIVMEQKLSVGAPVIQRPQQPQPKPQGR